MKKLNFWNGGRPITWDDEVNLQNQIATIEGAFSTAGAFIFSGCDVTPNGLKWNVSSGLVYVDSMLLQFAGATNVNLPIEIFAAPAVESDPRPDANQTLHNAQVEYKADWRAGSGQFE